jgi:hypothetical protein
MKYNRDPKPEILRIEELVSNVKVGDIKLPKFQRPFVWRRSNILTLWDSVYNGYPIGSILLWLTREKLASERRIGDLEINQRPDEYPINYLLDGQQRLSSLCGGLYWDGKDKKSIWNIAFDLESEKFIYPENETRTEWFPLNRLLGTFDFINQCRLFENHPEKLLFEANAQKLLKSIKDYKVAAVRIGDMTLNEVGPIFERINSTGRQLTIVDLMRAATWSEKFDLNDTINAVHSALEDKNFEEVPEQHILRNIAASSGFGINKENVDKLRDCTSATLQESARACVIAYQMAVDFLTKELPLTSYDYLPYALQLTLLVEFFRLNPSPSYAQRVALKKWFWESSFTRHFGTSNTGQNADDLKQMREFAYGNIEELNLHRQINSQGFVKEEFRLNKATSKSFALLLAHKRPRSLLDGSPVNTVQALSIVNRHEYHHIFPKAFLKSSRVAEDTIDMHANICLLNMGNNRTISDSRPSIYFEQLKFLLDDSLQDVLASNFISMEAYDAGLHEDYPEFTRLRSEELIKDIQKLCTGKY